MTAAGCHARLSRSRSSRRPACECCDNGRGKCLAVTTALSARNVRAVLGHLRRFRDAVPGPTGRWRHPPWSAPLLQGWHNLPKPAAKDRQTTALRTDGPQADDHGTFVADALIDLYSRNEIAASILLRGMEGFGRKHHLRTDSSLSLSEDLPLTAIAVDTRPNIEAVLGRTVEFSRPGLVTLERARLLSDEIDPVGIVENADEATKLTVYFGRHDRVYGVPAFEVICEVLHRRGIAGATVLLGVDGTAHGRRQRAPFFSRNAEVPMMVIAVGSGDRIGLVLPELGSLLRRPLMTLERVRICKRDGQLINRPEEVNGVDDHGFPLWQKLTVYTSEAARHNGQPIHRAIVRRLHSAGISGATSHRGIWGFHGDRPPHGDHFLQLGRHVPAVTVVIDTAERISTAFDVIDELTSAQDPEIPGSGALSWLRRPRSRGGSAQVSTLARTPVPPRHGCWPRSACRAFGFIWSFVRRPDGDEF